MPGARTGGREGKFTVADYKHVLVALDVGEEWHLVAVRALEVARRYGARLTLLHVVDGHDPEAPVTPDGTEALTAEAGRFLDAVAAHLRFAGVDKRVVVASPIGRQIVILATEMKVDLLVCGAHHRHGRALLTLSPLDPVVREIPCDLLLVRLPHA